MNWEQKLAALNNLERCSLVMLQPGSWRVIQAAETKLHMRLAGVIGEGSTPQEAVEDHWGKMTTLEDNQYIVVRAGRPNRAAVRWNGHMWESHAEIRGQVRA